MKKIILKFTLIVLLFLAWNVQVVYSIWTYGQTANPNTADTIIVLGAAAWYKEPSPVFKERINHAIELHKKQQAPSIIFTGGSGVANEPAESQVAKDYAIESGIPETSIFIETASSTTQENLANAQHIMAQQQLKTAIIVSDPLHMKRAMLYAYDLGITAYSSPTPTSRYQTLDSQLPFLFRELYYYQTYQVYRLIKPLLEFIPQVPQWLASQSS